MSKSRPPTTQGDLFDWAASQAQTTRKRQTRTRAAPLRVVPDPDHMADREQADAQMHKRVKARERGQAVKPPKP